MKQSSDGCKAGEQRVQAALSCGLALLVLTLTAACGPRDVPLPSESRPETAGEGNGGAGAAGGGAAAPSGGTGATGRAGSAADGGMGAPPQAGGGAGAGQSGGDLPFDAGTDPSRNQVQAGGLCARLAVIQCAAEVHCCFAPGRTREQCEASIRGSCSNDLYLDQIAGNAITGFDAPGAAAAYMELEDRSAACDIGIASWGLVALRSILKGTRAPNQSCKPPGTGALNDKPAQAAALASCTDLAAHACLPTSLLGDWTCAAKSGSGGNCVTDDNCQTGLYCRTTNMALIGKCAERLALGASCGTGTNCASLYCKGGKCVAAEQQVAFCLE